MIDKIDMDKLLTIIDELAEYLHELPDRTYSQTDYFAQMAFCFLDKQLSHTESFLLLYKCQHPDVFLTARSMIEGYAMLKYAYEKPQERSRQWASYIYISKYQMLKPCLELGKSDIQEKLDVIQIDILKYCSSFEKDKGIPIGDKKYSGTWHHDISITALVNKTSDKLLKLMYPCYCEWHHWNPNTFNDAYQLVEQGMNSKIVVYNPYCKESQIQTTIGVVFTCIINIGNIIADYFKDTDMQTRMSEYNTKFLLTGSLEQKPI